MYTYHFCAQYEVNKHFIQKFDGILTLSKKIKTMDDYRDIKKMISKEHAAKLTITSLSLLS